MPKKIGNKKEKSLEYQQTTNYPFFLLIYVLSIILEVWFFELFAVNVNL